MFFEGNSERVENELTPGEELLQLIGNNIDIVDIEQYRSVINYQDDDGISPLMLAVFQKDNLSLMIALLNEGADPNLEDKSGETSLTLAIMHKKFSLVRMLLNAGALAKRKNKFKKTAIDLCIDLNLPEIQMILLQSVPDTKPPISQEYCIARHKQLMPVMYRMTPQGERDGGTVRLAHLLQCGQEEEGHSVVEEIYDIIRHDCPEDYGRPFLNHYCVTALKPQIVPIGAGFPLLNACVYAPYAVEVLLNEGVNPNAYDPHNGYNAAIHLACNGQDGSAYALKLLLERGVPVNIQNSQGQTALMYAIYEQFDFKTTLLLEAGANVNVKCLQEKTVLHVLCSAPHISFSKRKLELLIDNGALINTLDNAGYTALAYAVYTGWRQGIRFLIKQGANVNACPFSLTPKNFVCVDELLLVPGFNLNLLGLNEQQASAFMHMMKPLWYGADFNIANQDSDFPLHIAACYGMVKAMQKLLSITSINVYSEKTHFTPLMFAAQHNQLEAANILLAHKELQIDLKDKDDQTALWKAASVGSENIVRCLLKANANPNINDKNNSSPLAIAVINNHVSCVQELIAAGSNLNIKVNEQSLLEIANKLPDNKVMDKLREARAVWPKEKSCLSFWNDSEEKGISEQKNEIEDVKIASFCKILQRGEPRVSGKGWTDTSCLHLLPDGKLIHTWIEPTVTYQPGQTISGADSTIRIWDIESRQYTNLQEKDSGPGNIRLLQYYPNNKLISVSSNIKIWDMQTGKCTKTFSNAVHYIQSFQLLDNGKIACSSDNTIKILDIESGTCTKVLSGHSELVFYSKILPNGQLISASNDKTIKLWDIQSGRCLKTMEDTIRPKFGLSFVSFSIIEPLPGGRLLVLLNWGNLIIWDTKTGKCIKYLEPITRGVQYAKLLPDGRLVVQGAREVWVWDFEQGTSKKFYDGSLHHSQLYCHLFLDGRLMVVIPKDLTLWDLNEGRCTQVFQREYEMDNIHEIICCVQSFPDGKFITGSTMGGIRVWDPLPSIMENMEQNMKSDDPPVPDKKGLRPYFD
jgi:ankyrin repeat protein/WD40 repeat protein